MTCNGQQCRSWIILVQGMLVVVLFCLVVCRHRNTLLTSEMPSAFFDDFIDWSLCPTSKPLSIYVYANNNNDTSGYERQLLLEALQTSEYSTADPEKACIFIVVREEMSERLNHSSNWRNHVIIAFDEQAQLPRAAIRVVSNSKKFRRGIDILTNTLFASDNLTNLNAFTNFPPIGTERRNRVCTTITAETQALPGTLNVLMERDINQLRECSFTLVRQNRSIAQQLLHVLKAGSVPILSTPNISLPFESIIDWSSISVSVAEARLHNIQEIVSSIGSDELFRMQHNGKIFFDAYLRDYKGFVRGLASELSARLRLPSRTLGSVERIVTNPVVASHNTTEQLTVIIMAYRREKFLKRTLFYVLNGLDIVNKVIIIWNDIDRPIPAFPRISAPVEIIRPTRNSLNNRFLYYKRVETDCVLQLDDDLATTKEEIIFGFGVWREERERLVSYVARKSEKGKDGLLKYVATPQCSHELGLTGYAFLHKRYMYEYVQVMPEEIRQIVDEHHNCEDIAMNFLVAHLTRKAPITIAQKTLNEYPNNKWGLSTKGGHYRRRSECIQFFTQIYGYDPLLTSRFQVVPHQLR